MMLLMSVFAVYAGVLYNDFFALPLDFFGTRYKQTSVVGSDIRVSVVRFRFVVFWCTLRTPY